MKIITLILLLSSLAVTFESSAQKRQNIDDAFSRRLQYDAKLLVAKYGNAKITDSSEKKFLILMKQAANATKWEDADRIKYLSGIRVLANELGLFANPDEGGEIAKKKSTSTNDPANPDEGGEVVDTKTKNGDDPANPDEGGEIFVKGTKATYAFYKKLFEKFTITRALMQDNKLLLTRENQQ